MKQKIVLTIFSFVLLQLYTPCKAQITNEQKKVIVEESLNWLGRKIDKGVINKKIKKSKELIELWEKEGDLCALQCHRLNEETGDIDFDFQCEVECNKERKREEVRIKSNKYEENRSQIRPRNIETTADSKGIYAHVDVQEIFQLMPETEEMNQKLLQRQKQMDVELTAIEKKHNDLLNELRNNSENWSEAISSEKMKELDSIAESYQELMQKSQENIQKMRDDLIKPISEKIQNTIQIEGDENNFLLIFDTSVLLYKGGTDATRLVKKKIGILD